MKYLWGVVLICLVFVGCLSSLGTYPVHIAGVVVEKDITEIDTIRREYWLKVVIRTEGGNPTRS